MRHPDQKRWTPKTGRLTPSCLRVLAVILKTMRPMTVRDVMGALGFRSAEAVVPILAHLRREGLIAYESGKARTIRATCRVTREEATPCLS